MDKLAIGFVLLLSLSFGFLGFHYGSIYMEHKYRKQACELGYAEYKVDSSGRTTWQWKDK